MKWYHLLYVCIASYDDIAWVRAYSARTKVDLGFVSCSLRVCWPIAVVTILSLENYCLIVIAWSTKSVFADMPGFRFPPTSHIWGWFYSRVNSQHHESSLESLLTSYLFICWLTFDVGSILALGVIYGFICNLLLETLYRCVTGTNQVTNAFNEMVVFPLDVNSKSDIEIDGREKRRVLSDTREVS